MHTNYSQSKHSQRGVASVEAILLIPFLLLLITLIISTSRYASHLIYNTIDARTSAWRSALFDQCASVSAARFGGSYLGSKCDTDGESANIYLTALAAGPEASLFVGLLHASGIPETTSATANSEFRAFLVKDSYRTVITAQHSLDAMPAWERIHMPDGYNRVLPSVE